MFSKHKSFIALSFFAVAMSFTALAQHPQRTPAEKAEHQLRWMHRNLGLTKEQEDKSYGILLHYAQEKEALRNEAATRRHRTNEKKEMNHYEHDELRGVLNAEQYEKYMLHVAEMKQRQRAKREASRRY